MFVGIGTHRQIIEDTDKKLKSINDDMESFGNSNKKLRKLGNLKGKLSNKVSTITKEHKFFSDNVSCPTCTQSIEESFRLNKIEEAESKAKDSKRVTKNWNLPSNSKKNENKLLKNYPQRQLN